MMATTSSRAVFENAFSVARRTVRDKGKPLRAKRTTNCGGLGGRLGLGPQPAGGIETRTYLAWETGVDSTRLRLEIPVSQKEPDDGFRGTPASVRQGRSRAGDEQRDVRLPLREASQDVHDEPQGPARGQARGTEN